MTKHIDPARTELADAIFGIESAQRAADVASEAVELAQGRLRTAKSGHAVAIAALEEATSPPRTLDQKLAAAGNDDERFEIVDSHNASLRREPLTAEDLKRLRQGVDATADALTIARSGLEVAEERARPTVSALSRATDRRTRAVQEVVRPTIGRLIRDVDLRVQELVAARAALAFVSSDLIDGQREERRRASFALNNTPTYPEEAGLKVDRDTSKRQATIAAWSAFAERITRDAGTPFPE